MASSPKYDELEHAGAGEVRPDAGMGVPDQHGDRGEDDLGGDERHDGRRLGVLRPRQEQVPQRVEARGRKGEGKRGAGIAPRYALARMPVRAVVFDFNGTLSDDEPILLRIYQELFAEHGRPLTEHEYYDELAGLSEEEIVDALARRAATPTLTRRADRSLPRAGLGRLAPCRESARRGALRGRAGAGGDLLRRLSREEIEPVVAAAGLTACVARVVAADDVAHGKPDPEGYLRARRAARRRRPPDVLAFEDTEAGVASASAAGAHVVGITRHARRRAAGRGGRARRPDRPRRCCSALLG